jgi:hypothetical protein
MERLFEDKRKEIRFERLKNPRPGDCWHEWFSPIFAVVSVSNEEIMIRYPERTPQGWYWSDKIETLTREEFEKRLTYNGNRQVCFADVVPSKISGVKCKNPSVEVLI